MRIIDIDPHSQDRRLPRASTVEIASTVQISRTAVHIERPSEGHVVGTVSTGHIEVVDSRVPTDHPEAWRVVQDFISRPVVERQQLLNVLRETDQISSRANPYALGTLRLPLGVGHYGISRYQSPETLYDSIVIRPQPPALSAENDTARLISLAEVNSETHLPKLETLPVKGVSDAVRLESFCTISLRHLPNDSEGISQFIGCFDVQPEKPPVLFVFEWQSLQKWLQSSFYKHDDKQHSFVNPCNRQVVRWSELFRLKLEATPHQQLEG